LTDQGKPIVKKFSDILLRDFHKSKGCKKDGVYTKQYTASLKNKLFGDYATHIKNMMNNTTVNQDKLVSILEIMFARAINPETQRKEIIINPKMTEDLLQGLVEKARGSIVELYATCEDDFVKGLELFEAIVEKQIMDTSQAQIKTLEATLQDSLAESPTKSDSTANPLTINTDDIDSSPDESTIIDSELETKNSINSNPSVLSADVSNEESESNHENKDEKNIAEKSTASNNLDPEIRPLEKSQSEPSQKNIMFVPAVYVSPNNNLIMKDDDDTDE